MRRWTTAHPRVDGSTGEFLAFHPVLVNPYVTYPVNPPRKSERSPLIGGPIPGLGVAENDARLWCIKELHHHLAHAVKFLANEPRKGLAVCLV